jgi:hypothetical protein
MSTSFAVIECWSVYEEKKIKVETEKTQEE